MINFQREFLTSYGWDDFFAGPGVTDDFMAERDQPAMQQRDGL